jgi:hypothetical protein
MANTRSNSGVAEDTEIKGGGTSSVTTETERSNKDSASNSPTPKAKTEGKEIEKPEERDGIKSVYTDLDANKCKTINSSDEGGWSEQECPGFAGYKLEVVEGDIRQTINVISPSKKKSELNLWSVVSSAFSSVGKKAEWRVQTVDGKQIPIALIVRFNASETPEKPEKLTSYLTVTKITANSTCVTDIVKPIKNANVKARQLADTSADKPCLKRR